MSIRNEIFVKKREKYKRVNKGKMKGKQDRRSKTFIYTIFYKNKNVHPVTDYIMTLGIGN